MTLFHVSSVATESTAAGGELLIRGGEIELDSEQQAHPHNKRLVEEGTLIPIDEPDPASRAELMTRAKELDIPNRSRMRTPDLAAAIAEAEEKEGGDA